MSAKIRLRSGVELPVSINEYNQQRSLLPRLYHRPSFCYAPLVGMDFGPYGNIRLCGSSELNLGNVNDGQSVLSFWRGEAYQRYRKEFSQYIVDEENCKHCVQKLMAGSRQVFAKDFDWLGHDDTFPHFPRWLMFRLSNTCNLACVMCFGEHSSRIRKQRDKLPSLPPAYPESFFQELRTMLPKAKLLSFSGGEPLLVREHIRIFHMLREQNNWCPIYVNTNATVIRPDVWELLETLPFRWIAVSMDAVNPQVHATVRQGLKHAQFLSNLARLRQLPTKACERDVFLNVTEHRKNWFELPAIFAFAAEQHLKVHLCYCIHPHNVTLYTLPTAELQYVADFLRRQQQPLADKFPGYDFQIYRELLGVVDGELQRRTPDWSVNWTNINHDCDGLLAVPRIGSWPFDEPRSVLQEVEHWQSLPPDTCQRWQTSLLAETQQQPDPSNWGEVRSTLAADLKC